MAKRSPVCQAWRIAKTYWTSEEKWSAWALLGAIIAVNLGNVYVGIRINEWNRAFYNALQVFDSSELFRQLGYFCIIAALGMTCTVYALYFNQMLQIRWRRWLTERYLNLWLTNSAYYKLQLRETIDNPDQRIAEDVQQFTTYICTLGVGLFSAAVGLASFLVILWGLSGPAVIRLGKLGILCIPGYLVWAALMYAGMATWLATRIGKPLVPLNFTKQSFEGDFRFSLVRVRENSESVASYGGEEVELGVFRQRFENILENYRMIMKRQMRLGWLTSGYAQIAVVFPVMVVSPRYFAKQIPLGGLMQVANAFCFVHDRLSFIISAYADIVSWYAVTERLSSFEAQLQEVHAPSPEEQKVDIRHEGASLAVEDVDVLLPDGTVLLERVNFAPARGSAVLITGPTGTGKSTLLRTIAGIWPFARGNVRIGEGKTLLVPQRPYLPLGTLASALLYPCSQKRQFSIDQVSVALDQVGLGSVVPQLEIVDDWSRRLSLGEQQRLAFARILLMQPNLLFLDEATAALDEAGEARLYGLLRSANWCPTVLSVGHRSTLLSFHDYILDVTLFIPFREPVMLPMPAQLENSAVVISSGYA